MYKILWLSLLNEFRQVATFGWHCLDKEVKQDQIDYYLNRGPHGNIRAVVFKKFTNVLKGRNHFLIIDRKNRIVEAVVFTVTTRRAKVGLWSSIRKILTFLNVGIGEDAWEYHGQPRKPLKHIWPGSNYTILDFWEVWRRLQCCKGGKKMKINWPVSRWMDSRFSDEGALLEGLTNQTRVRSLWRKSMDAKSLQRLHGTESINYWLYPNGPWGHACPRGKFI